MGDTALADELRGRGIRDERVLQAMGALARLDFLPGRSPAQATADGPVSIGHGQTISQPYVVALMTEALCLRGPERVLEIGTGSGYQTAVLAALARDVYSVEIILALALSARERLSRLGVKAHLREGNGYLGWEEAGPFDAVILTAAPAQIPEALVRQLAPGGRLVAPVGAADLTQNLIRITKDARGRPTVETLLPVRFVPMTGEPVAQLKPLLP